MSSVDKNQAVAQVAECVPAPATQQAVEVSDAMVLAALQVQYPATYGQYLRHPADGPKTSIRTEAEIDTARRMIAAALAAGQATAAQPVAEPADTVVLNAAMRAIQQAIELIGAPTDERMRAVRRVLRGAVIVAEDDGKVAPLPGTAYAALPEYGINTASHAHFRVLGFTADQLRAFADATHTLRASHGQAPAGVLEDAARWHWMAEYIVGTRTDLDDEIIASATVDELRKLVDADLAARKQGEKQ